MATSNRPKRATSPAAPAAKTSRRSTRTEGRKPKGEATPPAPAVDPPAPEQASQAEAPRRASVEATPADEQAPKAPARFEPITNAARIGEQILAVWHGPKWRGDFIDWDDCRAGLSAGASLQALEAFGDREKIDLARARGDLLVALVRADDRRKIDLARAGVFIVHRITNHARWAVEPEYLGDEAEPQEYREGCMFGQGYLLALAPAVREALEALKPEERADREAVARAAFEAAKTAKAVGDGVLSEEQRVFLRVVVDAQNRNPRAAWSGTGLSRLLGTKVARTSADRLGLQPLNANERRCRVLAAGLEGPYLSRKGKRGGWFIPEDNMKRAMEAAGADST